MKVITMDGLRAARRTGTIQQPVSYKMNGKSHAVTKQIVNGEMDVRWFEKPLGELMTFGSIADQKAFSEKVVLDVELGREQVPLLYKEIYDEISDPNLPKLLEAKWALTGACIFAEHIEAGEVKFSTLMAEQGPIAKIKTYTGGFEYTKEMFEYNQTYDVETLNKGMGEGWNALLNHLHLGAIITATYKPENKTAVVPGEAGDERWVTFYRTLSAAVKAAATAKRPGTLLLAATSDRQDIEQALKGFTHDGTVYPPIPGITTIVYYDGYQITVGKKEYSYPGVTPGKAYLIRPKRGFKELIKRDLEIETNQGDLSRLVERQVVGYGFRGVFAAIGENIQEISFS
ncbi:phage major capsid protein [Cohnella nanjingensis]|uniref:Aspartate ammonia-lyase n=1 Tax=Cohnella nanjingensis TaxID=1387779 RepID=A0A7X0VGE0_9BACL|nr:hypothetical protein [Cohnella nanjingensis]MBB6673012.1 aspartate ammonia-lyase [Cohnella nanjingensis]